MAKEFLNLPLDERREVLGTIADQTDRSAHLLEKDVWVVWALSTIYGAPIGEHLVFKGGTSLSKAYDLIQRFSEDVDLTYDIRAFAPDLVGDRENAMPRSRSEEKRWSTKIRQRLNEWVADSVLPTFENAILQAGLPAAVRCEEYRLFIDYEAAFAGTGYVVPTVVLEFGARSTGEPASRRGIRCDADGGIDGLAFPEATPKVMHAERTFWEKAMAIHVFCLQQRLRGDYFSRHWHDLMCLDEAGIADKAITDKALAKAVAEHEAMFFRRKDIEGNMIDYVAAVSGSLQLVPTGSARDHLEKDYFEMAKDCLLYEEHETFDEVINKCAVVAEKTNRANAG